MRRNKRIQGKRKRQPQQKKKRAAEKSNGCRQRHEVVATLGTTGRAVEEEDWLVDQRSLTRTHARTRREDFPVKGPMRTQRPELRHSHRSTF